MEILLVGASGTIGRAIVAELGQSHTFIRAGRKGADVEVDITQVESIMKMYEQVGRVDAVVCAAGSLHFGPLAELTPALNEISIESKLKGQMNVVLLGMNHVRDNGSFTLTTGIIKDDPILEGASAAMANGAISAFVKGAAIEMSRGIRINSVSPSVLCESLPQYGRFFPGFEAVPSERVARAYRKSIEGAQTGAEYTVY